jgi:hypothetical protein
MIDHSRAPLPLGDIVDELEQVPRQDMERPLSLANSGTDHQAAEGATPSQRQASQQATSGAGHQPDVTRILDAASDALRSADNDNAKLLAVRDVAEALENIRANGSAFDHLRDIGISHSIERTDIETIIDQGIVIARGTRTFGGPDWSEGVVEANSESKMKPPHSNGNAEYQADDHGTNVKPKQPEPKSKPRDVNDILQQHGEDAVRDALDQALSEDANPAPSSIRHNESGKGEKALPENRAAKRNAGAVAAALAGLKTATALQTMTFPQLKYIIPDLIVEGCVLLAGKPKARKSWLAYDVGLAVASGGYCLGDKKCAQGEVLFLALEDGDRRLQRRATKLLQTFSGKWPERFYYATKWPRANEGGIEAIDQWCEAHPDARLVVIDVLARFRAPSTNKNAYEQDYEAVSRLQELAVRRSITVLIVHHTRKGAAEDPVEEISGTLGLGGGVDAFLILKRTSSGGTLIGRGRDTEDVDLAMQFNDETCRWTILGQAADVQRSEQRGRVLVALEGAIEGLPTSEIVSHAHLTSRAAADVLLSDMAKDGQIERVKRGVYALPGTKIAKKDKKGDEYGENGANDHTRPHTRPSNESKAQGEAAHTPDPPGHVSVIEFLRWALTPGRRLVSDIEASARADGLLGEHQRIDTKPFRAAKMILGVVVEREGFGPGSKVYWRLPDNPDQGSPGAQTGCDTGVQMLEPGGDGQ